LFIVLFEEIHLLVHAVVYGWFDPILVAADRALFGADPTWIERYARYWVTETMQLAFFP
jgi:hypothetical protein